MKLETTIIEELKEEAEEKFKKIDIYKIFAYFLVCGFIGWMFETLAVWITLEELTDRGYFFVMGSLKGYIGFFANIPILDSIPLVWGLPIIEMYGIGGVIMILLCRHLKDHKAKIVVYGAILMTLFELGSSYFCTMILHHSYWDYKQEFLNFQGRICLRSSIAWGALSIVAIEFLMPCLDNLYLHIRVRKNFKIVIAALIIYTIICAATKYIIDPSIIAN